MASGQQFEYCLGYELDLLFIALILNCVLNKENVNDGKELKRY